jgi:hypothetical protein
MIQNLPTSVAFQEHLGDCYPRGVQAGSYDAIYLLSDFPAAEAKSYIQSLASRTGAAIHLHAVKLTNKPSASVA